MLNGLLHKYLSKPKATKMSIYTIDLIGNNGELIKLEDFAGKYILFVNVASKCGFTKQYKALQQLSETYKEQLVVIGCPCNQFGKQEPGSKEEIANFCSINFQVTFTLTEKLNAKGSNKHQLYKWLTEKELNGNFNSSVKWNFQKYLVSPSGRLVDVYYSTTKPLSKKITSHLHE